MSRRSIRHWQRCWTRRCAFSDTTLSRILFFFVIVFLAVTILSLWQQNPDGAFMRGKDWYGHLSIFSVLVERLAYGHMYWHYDQEQSYLGNLVFLSLDWPPLFYYAALILRICGGWIAPHIILLTPAFFLILLLVMTHKTAERIVPGSGGVAVLLTALFPGILLNTCSFNLEIAVCGMVMLIIYLLLFGRWWQDDRAAFSLGGAVGLAALIKFTTAIFIVVPTIIMVSVYRRRSTGPQNSAGTKRLGIAACAAVTLALLYYGNGSILPYIFSKATGTFVLFQENGGGYLSLAQRAFYYAQGGVELFTLPGMVLGAAGSAVLLTKQRVPGLLLLATTLGAAVIIIATPTIPQIEYLLPLGPLWALSTAVAVQELGQKKRGARWCVTAVIALLLIPSFMASVRGLRSVRNEYAEDMRSVVAEHLRPDLRTGVFPHRKVRAHVMWIEMFHNTWYNRPILFQQFVQQPVEFINEFDQFDVVLHISDGRAQWPDKNAFLLQMANFAEFYARQMAVYPAVFSSNHQDMAYDEDRIIIPQELIGDMLDKRKYFQLTAVQIMRPQPLEPATAFLHLNVWGRIAEHGE